jgi:acyl dehydratase
MSSKVKFESPTYTLTANDIDTFVSISGDANPLHVDEKYAARTQFGTRIAPGALVLSIATGLAYKLGFLSRSLEAFIDLTWKFRAPVKIGDTIRAKFEFLKKRSMPGFAGGLVTFNVAILNQLGKTVQKGKWTFLVRSGGKHYKSIL